MSRAALVVQTFSLAYVENFVGYLHGILQRHLDADAELVVCDGLDTADHATGLVFVIGENFPPFSRRTGCTYVFLNLSVVTRLGNPLSASLRGHRQVRRKRRMLEAKLPLFDVLLDYYAPQTAVLAHRMPLPVMGFDVAIAATDPVPMADREFDVCFVGGLTPRRQAVLDEMRAAGLVLSPQSGAPIEQIAARSRCCLNVHTERSNHLEVPRLVAALSTGCPVVTERSFGLATLGAGALVDERRFSDLAAGVRDMLADAARLERLGEGSAAWYRDLYLPRAEENWKAVCQRLVSIASSQSTAPGPTSGKSASAIVASASNG